MKKILVLFALVIIAFINRSEAQMPAFSFFDLEGNAFSQAKLDDERPAMIMLFDPYCDHCDQQAGWISEAAEKLENVQFVFVTIEPEKEPVQQFRDKHFQETSIRDVHFLQDLNFQFEAYFGYSDDAVNIYLYQPGRKKLKYFGKETEVDELLKYL